MVNDLFFMHKGIIFLNESADKNRKANLILKNIDTCSWKSDVSRKFCQKVNDIVKPTNILNNKIADLISETNNYLKLENISGN